MEGLNAQDIEKLKAKFSDDVISVKVQSLSRDKKSAMLVCYVQHTDVYDRIEEVDPAWEGTIVAEEWRDQGGDQGGDLRCFVRYKLIIKGVPRENVGEGFDPKGATSDAVKRTAMLFGVGRYLYDSSRVWIPYDESSDKYRQFTIEEYRAAEARRGAPPPAKKPPASAPAKAPPPVAAAAPVRAGVITVAEANTLLSEVKARKVDNLAFNNELRRRGVTRVIDLPSEHYAEVTEWIIRQNGTPKDVVEVETMALEALGITRDQVHAYIQSLPFARTPEAVAKNLTTIRTTYKADALRNLFQDVASRGVKA